MIFLIFIANYGVASQCTCNQLMFESECSQNTTCMWNNGLCQTFQNQQQSPAIYKQYCDQIPCPQLGCAYYKDKCINFSGCTAYLGQNDQECQLINNQCTSDGTGCIDKQNCSAYLIQTDCLKRSSSSGNYKCQWKQNSCQDFQCEDAPSTYINDHECDQFFKGCKSNGLGCTSYLFSCYDYRLDRCLDGILGQEGKCQIIDNLCQPLPCSSAIYTTTEQCQQISKKCVSDGFKCLDQLQECNQYKDNCSQIISLNGKCIKDQNNCIDIKCSDAPASLQTDIQCNQFLNGCVTTGQGCDKQKNDCSSYLGNLSICEKYIGINGQCYGSDQNQNCKYKQCEDADSTLHLDSQCDLFLKECITNGKGCLRQLKTCNEYFDNCDDYIGADGKCTGKGICQVKQCSLASLKIISTLECQQFSSQCIYNGYKCVEPQQCMQTTNPLVCSGNSQCLLSGVCMENNSCSNFKTYSLCLGNQNIRKCYWDNQCLDYTCDMAPQTSNTDQLCSDFLTGCVYNGLNDDLPKCVSINSPCNQFYGTKTACQQYKAQTACYGSPFYGQCQIKLCSDSGWVRSQNECNQFWENQCSFNGYNTCINLNQPCSSYYGTILKPCTNIIAQGQKCANTETPSGVPKQCKFRICSDAPNTFISNNDCSKWKQGCVSRGIVLGFGCKDSSSLCSTYFGTTSECEAFDGNGLKCSKYEKFCRAKSCALVVMNQSHQVCNSYWKNCVYDGQKCILKGLCDSYQLIGPNELTQSINCQGLQDIYGKNCIIGLITCQSPGLCTDYKVDQSKSQQFNIDYCTNIVSNDEECYYGEGTTCSYLPCSQIIWPKSQTDCNITKEPCQYDFNYQCLPFLECTEYTTSPYVQDLDVYCNNLKDLNGRFCGYNQGQTCVERTCTITIATGVTDLQKLTFCNTLGCSFNPSFSKFCSQRTLCSAQPTTGSLPIDKMIFCQTVKNQSGIPCSYQGSPYCNDVQACNFYTPSQTSDNNNAITCNSFKDVDNQICNFISSPYCVKPSTYECVSFNSHGTDQEQRFQCQQIMIGTIQCGYNETKNKNKCSICACSDVPAANTSECSSYMKNTCISDGVNCLDRLTQCQQYVASLTNQLPYCLALKTLDNTNCSYQSGLNCSNRLCSDLVGPTSQTDCNNFMVGCLFDGVDCIELQSSCELYILQSIFTTRNQRLQQCMQMVDSSNNICGYSPEFHSQCSEKQCEQLISPTKQQDCDNYASGCFFDGITCITKRDECNYIALTTDKLKYCNSLFDNLMNQCFYSGGTTCSYFPCETIPKVDTTNGCLTYSSRCELDTESQCNSLQCSENSSATTDIECSTFQHGCVTNGKGCIPASSDCSAYMGNKTQCEQFSGLNGQQKCSNNDQIISNCRNLQCEDAISPSSDSDCQKILPNCVFDGQTCVVEQNCDLFFGNQEQCQTYIALDGPCDGNNYYSSCFIKQCHQAPVSYNTDQECQEFYYGCVTTGNGCTMKQAVNCDVILNQTTCNQSQQCKWFQYCQDRPQNCYLLSTIPSVCANSIINGIKCVYDQKCRPIQCSDFPKYYNKHHLCNQESKNCTTNGYGCVEILNCNQYDDQNSCTNSQPLDAFKCTFDNSKCRPVQCEDLQGETYTKCDSQLQNCLSDGRYCVTSPIKCSQYKIQELCIQDSNQQPCLWGANQCYSYYRCQDIIRKTHLECQQFSQGCTTDGKQCIPIDRCEKIQQQVSCISGSDGQCGWLAQFQKCALFDKCEVAQGSINLQCQQYNTNCISDGVNCIKIDNCMNYLTLAACSNQGLDGLCYWDKKFEGSLAGTCKQLECKHIQGNTYEQCQILKDCTTDGQQCQNKQNCNQYQLQNQCNFGLDGQCLWQNNQCRQKQCTDVFYKTNRACNIALPNMSCISDGEQCQNIDKCQNYLTKQACTNRGTDGQCTYKNQCQTMTQCSDASNDQDVCKSSKQCYFQINDQHQTQCIQLDCSANYLINKRCEPVLQYDGKLYQTCSLQDDGQCVQRDPKFLPFQECYFQSQKTYRWLNDTCTTCSSNKTEEFNQNENNSNQTFTSFSELIVIIYIIL